MSNDRDSDLFFVGAFVVALTIFIGTLYFLFHSLWIVIGGIVCGAALILSYLLFGTKAPAPQPFEKPSIDHDERGWKRFDRRAT